MYKFSFEYFKRGFSHGVVKRTAFQAQRTLYLKSIQHVVYDLIIEFAVKKNPEITDATRKAFVDAFCALYKVKPMETITIQELTLRAGYNRCTFYQYFKDVYDLLAYLEDTIIAHIKKNIVANIQRGDLIDNFIFSFTKLLEGKQAYIEVLLDNPNSSRFAHRLKSEMIPIFMEQFHLSAKDARTRYILEFYLPAIISIIGYWIHSRRNIPTEELGALIRGLLEEGIMAQLAKFTVES